MAEVKQRLKQALRSAVSYDSDKPDQGTSLTFLISALRADLGAVDLRLRHRTIRAADGKDQSARLCERVSGLLKGVISFQA